MPYKMVWVSAPKDMLLPVLETEPDTPSYHCQYCKGWIEGQATRFEEDTLAPMSGRKGTVLHCIRCGNEIDFFGMRS